MENNVFTSNKSGTSPLGKDSKGELYNFEPLIDLMGTPNRGICETIHELPNEESSDVSQEMNEDFYSFSKNSMDIKVNATTNNLHVSEAIMEEKSEFYYSSNGYESSQKDCFVQTDEEIRNRELVDKEIQTDNMMALRRKLLMHRCSLDSTATPPSELRKQITDLRDELQETHVFHDLEIKVLQEEYLSDDSKSETDEDNVVDDLKKSLADAEVVYLDAIKEISNLKTANLELNEKMKEESLQYLSSKQELEAQISQLQMDVRRKNFEIENLKKDKADFDFRLELQTEKYEKRVRELELALSDARIDSPDSGVEKNPDIDRWEVEILALKRDNEELISTKKSLEAELEECSKKLKNYEEMATSLEDQKNILKIKEEICTYNENQISVILKKNEELTANIVKCQEEIKKIKTSYETSVKKLKEEWDNEVKVLKCEKDSLNDIIRQLSEENNLINEALKNSKIDNDSLNDIIRQLGNENKILDEALKNTKADDEGKIIEEQNRLISEIKELQNVLKIKDEEMELLREKQKADFKKLNEEKNVFETEVEKLKIEKNNLNENIQKKIDELKMAEELLKECEEKSEKDLKNLKNEYDGKIEALLREKDELNEIIYQKSEELLEFKSKYEEELGRIELDWKVRLQTELQLVNASNEESNIKSESLLPMKVENPAYEEQNLVMDKEEMDNTFDSCQSTVETTVKTENLKEEVTLIENPENLSYLNELKPGALVSFEDFVKEFSEFVISRQIITQEEIEASGNVFYLLVDKYLSLLGEYEILRNQNREIESRAFECLETLQSQLEASDSTLNASNNNSLNFTGDVKCSTMMCEPSEIETTVINDVTLAVNDPLAITRDLTFQTPLKTPMRTPFKTPLRTTPLNSKKQKSVGKFKNEFLIEKMNLISEYEEIIAEKAKLTDELERRIVKLEDLATVFEDEKERIREKYLKDVEKLKNSLKEKSEELNDLRNKLIVETISLNSDFENNLNSTPTVKILPILIETIMERCRIVEQELREKFNKEKSEWDEQKKHLTGLIEGLGNEKRILSDEIEIQESKIAKMSEELKDLKEINQNLNAKRAEIEGILANQNEEIRLLYSRISEFDALKNNLATADEIISSLRNEVEGAEALKSEIIDLRAKLQDGETNLKSEINEKEKILKDLEKTNQFYEKVQVENENLKKRICQSEDMISELQAGLVVAKEEQNNNEIRVQELINEIELLKNALSEGDVKNKALEVEIEEQKANKEILNCKLHEAEDLLEKNKIKLSEVQKSSEEAIEKLNLRIQDLSAGNQQIENLNNALSFAENKNKELEEIINGKNAAIEELNVKLTESEDQLKTCMEEWKTENGKIESLNKELQGEIELLSGKLSETEDRLQLQINGASDEVKSLNAALEGAELKNKELQKALVSLEEKLKELEEARRLKSVELEEMENKLASNMEEARAELEKATDKVSALNAELEGAANKNKELEKLVADLDVKVKNFEEIETDLNSKLSGAESKNKQLNELLAISEELKKEQVEALNLKLKDAENETEVNKAELRRIQKELVISEETISKLSVRVEELSSDNDAKNAIIAEKEIKIKQVIELENKLLCAETEQNVLREENDKLLGRLKEIEGLKDNLSEALSDIQNCLDLPVDTFSKFLTDNRKIFTDRINEYKKSQITEIESLKNENKIQMEKFKGDIGNLMSLMSESDRKADKLQNSCETITGEINDLRSLAISLQNELKKTERKKEVDHSFYTRRMGRLEELNKLLGEIIQEIVNFVKLPEPEKLNLFSVRNLMSSKKQIMDYISSLTIHDAHEDSCEEFTKIKCARCGPKTDGESILKMLLDVQKRVGLSESVLSTAENISGRIDRLIENEKEKLNEVIEALTKDKKILNEDNQNLQKEKIKIEIKLSDSERLNKEQLEEINKLKVEISSLQTDFLTNNVPTRSKTGRKSDLCSRRMDKLEELNQSLSELLTEIISLVKVPNAEKLNLFSVRNVGAAKRQIVETITNLVQDIEKVEELKAQNAELDEECESYAKDIKNLQKKVLVMEREAIAVREALETEICRLKDEKHALDIERDGFNKRIEELEGECEKLKNLQVAEGYSQNCKCAILSKELKEIKRSVLNKERRILELEDMEAQTSALKSQIKYLENALDVTKRKVAEEEEKNKKLHSQLKEVSSNEKHSRKSSADQELLEELRMRGTMSGGVVQEIVEKEKIRKLTKDNAILKDLCRARYAEIKRLESEMNALKNCGAKNSNSMDSPIRTRCYNTRSRKLPDDPKSPWRFFKDKENQNL